MCSLARSLTQLPPATSLIGTQAIIIFITNKFEIFSRYLFRDLKGTIVGHIYIYIYTHLQAVADRRDFWASPASPTGHMSTSSGYPLLNWGIFFEFL